jgi:histidinol-phosphatase (PHP family)
MQRCNFHTHTKYSDGTDTPREMIEAAIGFGFRAIGFSDHSYTHQREDYPMSIEGQKQYRREIRELAEEYKGQIRVYCGIEQDAESSLPGHDYDYILSSVHELIYHGEFYPLDSNEELHRKAVETLFGGNYLELAKRYFYLLTEHVIKQKTDIVGHFDLITKYSLAPEDHPEYMDAALEAIREIVKHCNLFELNTGAIARGLRTVPYPAPFMVDEIKRLGGRFIMNSDCHYRAKLTCWFDEGEKFLASHGFVKDEHADLNDIVKDIEIWR